jgi:hypothetical protein
VSLTDLQALLYRTIAEYHVSESLYLRPRRGAGLRDVLAVTRVLIYLRQPIPPRLALYVASRLDEAECGEMLCPLEGQWFVRKLRPHALVDGSDLTDAERETAARILDEVEAEV